MLHGRTLLAIGCACLLALICRAHLEVRWTPEVSWAQTLPLGGVKKKSLPAGRVPPFPVTASQIEPTDTAVDLAWTTQTSVTRWTILRDGNLLTELPASARVHTDLEPDFGVRKYTVVGWREAERVCEGRCSYTLRPAPVATVFCTQLDPTIATVVIEWRNAMVYDEIRVFRRGILEETLPGDFQSTVSIGVPMGKLELGIVGVIEGVESTRVGCRGSLRDAPELGFSLKTVATVGRFDPATGAGTIRVGVTASEDPSNPGFPHDVQGLQLATDYNPKILTPISIEPGAGLSSPDFFDGQLLPDGLTVGMVMDFHGQVTLDLSSEKEVAIATYETVIEELVGSTTGVTTRIGFRNGLGTGGPIDNIIVVDGKSVRPTLTEAMITIFPEGGVNFRRGDLEGDGMVDFDDVGFLVATLSAFAEIAPLDDCLDASDLNDDGAIDLADLFTLVGAMFEAGPVPAVPFDTCAPDPTPDEIPCARAPACPGS